MRGVDRLFVKVKKLFVDGCDQAGSRQSSAVASGRVEQADGPVRFGRRGP